MFFGGKNIRRFSKFEIHKIQTDEYFCFASWTGSRFKTINDFDWSLDSSEQYDMEEIIIQTLTLHHTARLWTVPEKLYIHCWNLEYSKWEKYRMV